ncbi:MAG TPA: adenylate/guanylate cyclase domain-containing protein [Alphaproteobacteria bacterium]|nr:adenylate/guanylate cyclase domain-containing protein [Alphaproteobacteria bacterium]
MNDEAGIAFSRPPSLVLPKPVEWMLTDGRGIRDGKEFFSNLCDRLVESGVPLWRANLSARVLHPQLSAINLIWRRGAEVERILREYAMSQSDAYLNSPIRVIYEGAAGLRRRLDVPDPHLDFPILGELRAAGATDYVAMAVPDWQGQSAALTWASDRPGGFSVADLTLLNDILPLFGLFVERYKADNIANNVLHTYLGAQTGQRVLHGSIRRGEVEAIHAVLWYCDLRGFTALSDAIPADELIELLNAYFEAVGEPVLTRGGEILKFIGDAMLAIFPLDAESGRERVGLAMESALEALENVAKLNEARKAEGKRVIRLGIALHVGDVAYGNIGTPARLDFTVIGPAVNKVVRIEALSKALDRSLLLSSDFAKACVYPVDSLGFHPLRGISEPEEIFAPSLTGREAIVRRAAIRRDN